MPNINNQPTNTASREPACPDDHQLALWFTPDAIRDHFADDQGPAADWVAHATDEQLLEIGRSALHGDELYSTFHRILATAVTLAAQPDATPDDSDAAPSAQHDTAPGMPVVDDPEGVTRFFDTDENAQRFADAINAQNGDDLVQVEHQWAYDTAGTDELIEDLTA